MENLAEKTSLPVVAVDGAKIKTIRENGRLTQLYVANVVGVTTDTISRWENNRYPSIKRDNAEKLATALGVDLEEILRREEPPPSERVEETPVAPLERRPRYLWILLLTGTALLVAAVFFFTRKPAAAPVAERKLPRFAAPAEIMPVQITIQRRDALATGLIVKERLPSGWQLVGSIPAAATGQPTGEVKWLIPPGAGPVAIDYTVRIPSSIPLSTIGVFDGEIVARAGELSARAPSGGDRSVAVTGKHWADRNGDGRIDDDEIMPAYYMTEEMKGLGLDWKTIETIWSSKGYRWNPASRQFDPVK